jgi:hypothetical protein
MRPAIPPMHAAVAARKERLHHAHDGHKKPRWPRRHLLATRHARDRQEVACLVGGHRHTISRGLARDAVGGLEAWRAT